VCFDVVIANGIVVDGTGQPCRQADVGIKDGRIVALSSLKETTAIEVI